MLPYKVELFDRGLVCRVHTNLDSIPFKEDYTSPVQNTMLLLYASGAAIGQYLKISGNGQDFLGIVTSVNDKGSGQTEIAYVPLVFYLLNTSILVDTDAQGKGYLEDYIAGKIRELFVANPDPLQNIQGLTVRCRSQTSGWGFNLKSEAQGMHHLVCNFYSSIIARALTKYQVSIIPVLNATQKTLTLEIGRTGTDRKVIEADLPNVVAKNIIYQQTNNTVNKLVVYNQKDYTQTSTWYLHTDGTYSSEDKDRIIPVHMKAASVSPEEDQEFAEAAASLAGQTFNSITYKNLIEITCMKDDSLIRPMELEIGQIVSVISEGVQYESILTGRDTGDLCKLIFGDIRVDLTKLIKNIAQETYEENEVIYPDVIDDYDELSNRPVVNGNVITGQMTSDEIGLRELTVFEMLNILT